MTYNELLLTLHVLTAVLWVGGGVTLHIGIRRAMRFKRGQELHERITEFEWIGERFYPIFSIILIVAGVFLVDEAGYELDQTWITIGFAGWIISFLIGIGFYGREGKRRATIVEEKGADAPEVMASIQRTANVNAFELAILLLVIVDMTTKPGM